MKNYLDLATKIMVYGVDRAGRNGTTRALFTEQLRFDLSKGFPAVTTKRLFFDGVVSELLWFLEGSGDDNRLKAISGKERTIWTDNAQAGYWKPKAKFDGDLGRVYGVQWRSWASKPRALKRGEIIRAEDQCFVETIPPGVDINLTLPGVGISYDPDVHPKMCRNSVDQIFDLVERIKKDPYDRRLIVTAWNPGEIDEMALPPCHMIVQFFVANGKLSCHMNQRSCDYACGVPFNVASYALLTHLIAQVTGLGVGELILTLGDVHIYEAHLDMMEEQLRRDPKPSPTLWLNPSITNIDKFTMSDIRLENYESHSALKYKMIV